MHKYKIILLINNLVGKQDRLFMKYTARCFVCICKSNNLQNKLVFFIYSCYICKL